MKIHHSRSRWWLLFLTISASLSTVSTISFRNSGGTSKDFEEEDYDDDDDDDVDNVSTNFFIRKKTFCVPDYWFNSKSYHVERARGIRALFLRLRGSKRGNCNTNCFEFCEVPCSDSDPVTASRNVCECLEEPEYFCVENAVCSNRNECVCQQNFEGDGYKNCTLVDPPPPVVTIPVTVTFTTGREAGMSSNMQPQVTFVSNINMGTFYTDSEFISRLPGLGASAPYTLSLPDTFETGIASIRIKVSAGDPEREDAWFFNGLRVEYEEKIIDVNLYVVDNQRKGVWLDSTPYNDEASYLGYPYRDEWTFNLTSS